VWAADQLSVTRLSDWKHVAFEQFVRLPGGDSLLRETGGWMSLLRSFLPEEWWKKDQRRLLHLK